MTAKLRPMTPTSMLTATKPMATWITTVSPMVLRPMLKPTAKTATTYKTTVKLRPRTLTPMLTATKPMAT